MCDIVDSKSILLTEGIELTQIGQGSIYNHRIGFKVNFINFEKNQAN